MLGPHTPHALFPGLRRLLDALDDLVPALTLHRQEQLELIVVGALWLLVELLAALHGGHDGLDVILLVDEERDGAAAAGDDLGELAEGVCRGVAVVFDGDGEGAEAGGVEAAAVNHGRELTLEVRIQGSVARCHGRHVEGVFGIELAGAFGGGSIALGLAGRGSILRFRLDGIVSMFRAIARRRNLALLEERDRRAKGAGRGLSSRLGLECGREALARKALEGSSKRRISYCPPMLMWIVLEEELYPSTDAKRRAQHLVDALVREKAMVVGYVRMMYDGRSTWSGKSITSCQPSLTGKLGGTGNSGAP